MMTTPTSISAGPTLRRPGVLLLAVLAGTSAACLGCLRPADGDGPAMPGSPPAEQPAVRIDARLLPDGEFAVTGAWLGMSPETYQARYAADAALAATLFWAADGETGMIGVRPADGSATPVESAVFLDGQLVGFAYTVALGGSNAGELAHAVEGALGAAGAEPPAWCETATFFADYEPPREGSAAWFWGDESRRAVLILSEDQAGDSATFLLAHVDDLAGAIDACVDPLIAEMEVTVSAEPGD